MFYHGDGRYARSARDGVLVYTTSIAQQSHRSSQAFQPRRSDCPSPNQAESGCNAWSDLGTSSNEALMA